MDGPQSKRMPSASELLLPESGPVRHDRQRLPSFSPYALEAGSDPQRPAFDHPRSSGFEHGMGRAAGSLFPPPHTHHSGISRTAGPAEMMRIVPVANGFKLVIPRPVLQAIKSMEEDDQEVTFLLSPSQLEQPQVPPSPDLPYSHHAFPPSHHAPFPSALHSHPLHPHHTVHTTPVMATSGSPRGGQGASTARPKHYKCSRCGKPKKGHVCPLANSPPRTAGGAGGGARGPGSPGGYQLDPDMVVEVPARRHPAGGDGDHNNHNHNGPLPSPASVSAALLQRLGQQS